MIGNTMGRLWQRDNIGWLFILVATIAISLFYFYPMVQSFILSFQTGMGSNLTWAGFDNWIRLFGDPTLKQALINTFTYLIIQVPIMILLALVLSVLLNDATLKMRGFFRVAIFLPSVTSLVAYSILFKYLFSGDGIINQFLVNLSIISQPIQFLSDPFWAKVTVIIAITWRDRKSTRLNSSHVAISYAVFCLK